MKSLAYQEVESFARTRNAELRATDFTSDTVMVSHEDGSIFFISDALIEEYMCKADGKLWVVVFAEHHKTMVFPYEDLTYVRVLAEKHWAPTLPTHAAP